MKENPNRVEIYTESLNLRRDLELLLCEKGQLTREKTVFLGPVDVSTSIIKYTGLRLENWEEKIRIKTTGDETVPEDTDFIMISRSWESKKDNKFQIIAKYRIGKAPGQILKFGFIEFNQYRQMVNDYKPVEEKDLPEALSEIRDILKRVK